MNLIRSLISALILALVAVSLYGIAWWQEPPAPLSGYTSGGKAVLAALCVAGVLGIVRLWTPPRRA